MSDSTNENGVGYERAKPWPIDVHAAKKGDRIDVAEVERMVNEEYGTAKFSMKAVQLVGDIERGLAAVGKFYAVCQDHGCIVLCTDSEAIAVNDAKFKTGERKMFKSHRFALAIDPAHLTESERMSLYAMNRANAAKLLAIIGVNKEHRIEGCRKRVPSLGYSDVDEEAGDDAEL
jgi:hypothetical protein